MPDTRNANARLDSWKAIATYFGKDVRTVIRWEQRRGLPVHRVPGGGRQSVFAYLGEIEAWLRSGAGLQTELRLAGEVTNGGLLRSEQSSQSASDTREGSSGVRRRWPTPRYVGIALALALVGIAITLIPSLNARNSIRITGETQLTDDNTAKTGLVTDGDRIYFGEVREGRMLLSEISVHSGTIRQIPTSFTNAEPEDISADGRRLLVLAWDADVQEERALWIVPVDGTATSRVGQVFCHSAAWSPNGQRIVFAVGSTIYLTTDSGTTIAPIHTFSAVPAELRWSLDGARLQFQLQDRGTGGVSFWEIALGGMNHTELASLVPLHATAGAVQYSSKIIDRDDRDFLGSGEGFERQILLLGRSGRLWQPGFELRVVARAINFTDGLATDTRLRKIFLLRGSGDIKELEWFDRHSREFRPYLPGVSGDFVDYSRDGRWIAYVKCPEKTLWISQTDGEHARRITTPVFEDLELPRWSPDGTKIAFMAKESDKPYRIYVTSVESGGVRSVSEGLDNQGAPTWSSDGKWLAYGNVRCQEAGTCAIHRIELASGKDFTLTGSEGLETARWSPNGKFIAALQPERHEVYVFDLSTLKWRKLAEGINGNDLTWSGDSRSLYASRTVGDKPEIVQIQLVDRKLDSIVDLSDFGKLTGRVSTWFTVAPDKSIIFLRETRTDEIYALDYGGS
jgi:Tol biopolymer transport system component